MRPFFSRVRFVWPVLCVLSACHRKVSSPDLIDKIFSQHEYVFVWAGELREGQVGAALKEAHSLTAVTPPNQLQAGWGYVFHPKDPQNIEELGSAKMPDWIRRAGCSVTTAPTRAVGFVYPFIGGPEFVIRFKCSRDAFRIEGRVDPYLAAYTKGSITVALVLVRDDK